MEDGVSDAVEGRDGEVRGRGLCHLRAGRVSGGRPSGPHHGVLHRDGQMGGVQ